jgi:hypothetical protein
MNPLRMWVCVLYWSVRRSVLWLSDNPCADTPNYRAQVIRALPALTKLDNEEVKPEERAQVEEMELPPLPRPATPPLGDNTEIPQSDRTRSAPQQVPHRHASPADSRPRSGRQSPGSPPSSNGGEKIVRSSTGPILSAARARSSSPPVTPPRVPAAAAAGNGRPPTSARTNSDAVLYAVLKLLDVLDDSDLHVVRKEIDARFGLA